MVGLRANVPADAFTAGTLGTERIGSGVVIREDGLVLTIGYLITEAETVWLITADGRAVPGHALAFDQTTGFGLVQALGQLDLPALELGNSDAVNLGTQAIVAAGGGRQHAVEAKIVGQQEFAGYWEYLLDDAFFTAPAHPFWSGAALIGSDGKLLGTGSLILQQGDGKRRMDMNMIVPIGLLRADPGRPADHRPQPGAGRGPGSACTPWKATAAWSSAAPPPRPGRTRRPAPGRPHPLGRRRGGHRPGEPVAQGLVGRHRRRAGGAAGGARRQHADGAPDLGRPHLVPARPAAALTPAGPVIVMLFDLTPRRAPPAAHTTLGEPP